MSIVTIFAGSFGADEELARNVATRLQYPFIGRELLAAASQRCEVAEAKLNDLVEKEPHWWERWMENLRPYRIALQAAMSEAALGDNLVYCGHLGHALLPGIRHVLRVLVTAPLEYRVEQARASLGLDVKEARRYVDQVDKAHSRRLTALFGSDWRDPGQYALVLNIAQISAIGAEGLIAAAAKLLDYQPTAESKQALADLALATQVQAHLLTYPRLRDLNIQVRAKGGEVLLQGILPASTAQSDIKAIVEKIPGANRIIVDFVYLPSSVAQSL